MNSFLRSLNKRVVSSNEDYCTIDGFMITVNIGCKLLNIIIKIIIIIIIILLL